MFKRFSNNYAPISDTGAGGMSTEMSKDDILDYLNADDDKGDKKDDDKPDDVVEGDDEPKPKDKAKDKVKEKKEPEPDDDEKTENEDDDEEIDLDELEESLKEPSEENLELVTPVSRARILKKYPNIFKDFPYLEKAYYREQQYTEIFSHPDDAKQAAEKANTLDQFETDIFSGNTEVLLRAVKDTTPKAFNKLVDNYLPTLARVDNDAHTHVVGNVIKQTIMAMVRNGKSSNNEALTTAAQILNQFVFASNDFEPPSTLTKNERPEVEDEEKTQLRARNQALIRERFEEARGELNTKVNNSIKSVVEQNIDPKDAMSDYVKRNAVRDAMEQVEKLIDSDTRFKTIVNKLWENAYKANFSKTSVDSIRSAYMSKAKTLLDAVVKKSRNEALRGIGKRVRDDDDTKARKPGQRSKSDNDERPRSSKSSGNSKEIPKGMSSLEFLMQDDD